MNTNSDFGSVLRMLIEAEKAKEEAAGFVFELPYDWDETPKHPEIPPFYIAYAYSPREIAIARGCDHIITRDGFTKGRLHREAGRALCQSRSKRFWGLTPLGQAKPTCPKCLEIAQRHGIKWESES